jgi:hypothetical protein
MRTQRKRALDRIALSAALLFSASVGEAQVSFSDAEFAPEDWALNAIRR